MSVLSVPVRTLTILSSSQPWAPAHPMTAHLTGQATSLAPAASVGEDILGLAVIAAGAWAAHALFHWSWGWSIAASVGVFVVLPVVLFAVLGATILAFAAARPSSAT
jgi:hypothetical protein